MAKNKFEEFKESGYGLNFSTDFDFKRNLKLGLIIFMIATFLVGVFSNIVLRAKYGINLFAMLKLSFGSPSAYGVGFIVTIGVFVWLIYNKIYFTKDEEMEVMNLEVTPLDNQLRMGLTFNNLMNVKTDDSFVKKQEVEEVDSNEMSMDDFQAKCLKMVEEDSEELEEEPISMIEPEMNYEEIIPEEYIAESEPPTINNDEESVETNSSEEIQEPPYQPAEKKVDLNSWNKSRSKNVSNSLKSNDKETTSTSSVVSANDFFEELKKN